MPNVSTKPQTRQQHPEPHAPRRVFPEPVLSRAATTRRRLRLTPAERRDTARLERIGRTPIFERTAADLAFEDAYSLGEGYPASVADAIDGLLAGVRAAERRAGRDLLTALRVETDGLRPATAADVRDALRRGVEL